MKYVMQLDNSSKIIKKYPVSPVSCNHGLDFIC